MIGCNQRNVGRLQLWLQFTHRQTLLESLFWPGQWALLFSFSLLQKNSAKSNQKSSKLHEKVAKTVEKAFNSTKKVQKRLLKYKISVLSLKYTNTVLYFTYLGFSCIYRIKFNAFKISIISKFNFINNFADNLTKAGILVFDNFFPQYIVVYLWSLHYWSLEFSHLRSCDWKPANNCIG